MCARMLVTVLTSICVSWSVGLSAMDNATMNCAHLDRQHRIACLEKILEADPCNKDAIWKLVYSYRDTDDADQLMAFLDLLSDLEPNIARPYKIRALLLKYTFGDDVSAEKQIRIAASLLPCPDEEGGTLPPTRENANKIWERARMRYQRKDFAGAEEDIETYLTLVQEPQIPSVFTTLAMCRKALGDLEGAVEALTLEIQLFPHQAVSVLPARARLREALGDETGAQQDIAQAARLEKEARLLEIRRLDERIAEQPETIFWYGERSRLRALMQDLNGALEDCERIIALRPKLPSGYLCRAQVRELMGDAAGAKADREWSWQLSKNQKQP